MNFTTIDRDNDLRLDGNCAIVRGGAWWHNNCSQSTLTGDAEHVNWYGLDNMVVKSRMMIKKISRS